MISESEINSVEGIITENNLERIFRDRPDQTDYGHNHADSSLENNCWQVMWMKKVSWDLLG